MMNLKTTAAAALLGLMAASGAHAQGTGQQPTTGSAQQAPGAQTPMPGMQGGGMMQQAMPMMQGQAGQGQGGMMMCPMMKRMASLDERVQRLEEKAGIAAPAQQTPR